MNKHFKIGLALLLLMSVVMLTSAEPPGPPITVKGYVFSPGVVVGTPMVDGTNVSINNTNTTRVILTSTFGGPTSNQGFYHLDINGTNGDVVKVVAYNNTQFGYNSSIAINNTVLMNITINDTRPSPPLLISPRNLSLITTRAPNFSWNNSYDRVNGTGIQMNYTLQISDNSSFPSTNASITGINETSNYTNFTLGIDLLPGVWYWRVQAIEMNTSAVSQFSQVFNFTIVSTTACSLNPQTVVFGVLGLNRSNNTVTDNPRPIVIRNSGNSLVNVSINATDLWNSSLNPSIFYQWEITDNATNSFVAANTTFLNMSKVIKQTIDQLRYVNATFTKPAARVELNVTAPAQEPPGDKTSDILLICTG